jgi:ribonuclease BN (tRNA processing enzyme)
LEKLPFPVQVIELEEGIHKIPFTVECCPLVHSSPCYGYRVEIDGKVIVYCTDTGVCDNVVSLARNADLLITECGLKPGEESPAWPHLNPEDAIRIAREANTKHLALMHFGAEVYKTLDERKAVQEQFEKEWHGLIVATDNMTVDV